MTEQKKRHLFVTNGVVDVTEKVIVRARRELSRDMYDIANEHRHLAHCVTGRDIEKDMTREIRESMISIVFAHTCLEAYINTMGKEKIRNIFNYNWKPLKKWNEVARALAKQEPEEYMDVFKDEEEPFRSFVELVRVRGKLVHFKAALREPMRTKYGRTEGTINWVNSTKAERACGIVKMMIKKLHDSTGTKCPNWLEEAKP